MFAEFITFQHNFTSKGEKLIRAFVFIEAEPGRVQDLVSELAGLKLASSVIKEVHAVTGRYDLVALDRKP